MINYYILSISDKKELEKIINNKINIISIKYLDDEIRIKVSYEDYKKIKNLFLKVNLIRVSGKKRIYEDIMKYKNCLISFIFSIILIIFLSHNIFYINVDTNNDSLKKEILEELYENNITVFSLKRSYEELNNIKKEILSKNDNIQWLEFEEDGTVLNVKVIEKIKKYNNFDLNKEPTDIVARKSGYIRKIYSTRGDVLKNTDDYVEKGETIISGNLIKNDEVVAKTNAKGLVYAEVWYIKKLTKDVEYITRIKTDKSKKRLVLKIGNRSFNILSIKVNSNKSRKRVIFGNKIFKLISKKEPIYVNRVKKYTDLEVINYLKNKGRNDIFKTLDKTEYILEEKTLKKHKDNDKITIEVLYKVYEEIGKTVKAKEIKEKEE